MRTLRHLEPQCDVCTRSMCREEVSCEVYLSTLPVGYSGTLPTVNETNCNKNQLKQFLRAPFQFHPDLSHHDAPEDWMERLFNLSSWFVVLTIFHRDSGSKIRSKFHRPIFAGFVQSKKPLSLEAFLFFWSEMICASSFASASHSVHYCLSIRLRVVIHDELDV